MVKRRPFSTDFKTRVTLEAIAKKYGVHPNVIAGWKRRLIEQAARAKACGGT